VTEVTASCSGWFLPLGKTQQVTSKSPPNTDNPITNHIRLKGLAGRATKPDSAVVMPVPLFHLIPKPKRPPLVLQVIYQDQE
jgi:hypothetical protein